jgi:hypothetical protein
MISKFVSRLSSLAIIVLFVYFLSGCRIENNITAPGYEITKNSNSQVPSIGSSYSPITLPNSKQNLFVSKEMDSISIKMIDKYLLNHTILTPGEALKKGITPNLAACGTHYQYCWVGVNEYKAINTKIIGIFVSSNIISYDKAHNTYAFSKIYVNSASDIDNAYSAGFSYDNMMFALPANAPDASTTINNLILAGKNVASYFVDEPVEKNTSWTSDIIGTISQTISPKKLFLSSYKWPAYPLVGQTYGSRYGSLMNGRNNVFIMCDQYYGDGYYGRANNYWDEFRSYYGVTKNISNWTDATPHNDYDGDTWDALFSDANAYGLNEIWLYACNSGNEDDICDFMNAAFINGWALKKYKYATIYWQCDAIPACKYCTWGDPNAGWYISSIQFTGGEQYESH